jgi:hypothetical protein
MKLLKKFVKWWTAKTLKKDKNGISLEITTQTNIKKEDPCYKSWIKRQIYFLISKNKKMEKRLQPELPDQVTINLLLELKLLNQWVLKTHLWNHRIKKLLYSAPKMFLQLVVKMKTSFTTSCKNKKQSSKNQKSPRSHLSRIN